MQERKRKSDLIFFLILSRSVHSVGLGDRWVLGINIVWHLYRKYGQDYLSILRYTPYTLLMCIQINRNPSTRECRWTHLLLLQLVNYNECAHIFNLVQSIGSLNPWLVIYANQLN